VTGRKKDPPTTMRDGRVGSSRASQPLRASWGKAGQESSRRGSLPSPPLRVASLADVLSRRGSEVSGDTNRHAQQAHPNNVGKMARERNSRSGNQGAKLKWRSNSAPEIRATAGACSPGPGRGDAKTSRLTPNESASPAAHGQQGPEGPAQASRGRFDHRRAGLAGLS